MNKATEIVVGAGAGAVASVILDLLKLLIAEAEIVFNFRYVSKEFTTTMKDLQPILEKIERLGKADDLNTLKVTLEKARDLVQRCSRVTKWQVIKKSIYTRKIWKIQKAMVSFCQLQLPLLHHANQLETLEDIKTLEIMMRGIDKNYNIFIKKLDDFMKAISNFFQIVNRKLHNNHREVIARLKSLRPSNRASVYRPLCPVPGLDKSPVGFDWPLVKLKKKLLDNSVDCLVVSAAPGCGKTTLVTMLCNDDEIKNDLFSSKWVEMEFPNVEALVLHIYPSDYALPEFISRMKKLKIVIIINHGFHPVRVSNLSCLSSLPNLKRIRLQNVSITFLDILQLQLSSLKKLSLVRCSFGEVSHDTQKIHVFKALQSLQEIDIDSCDDLVGLPFWIFEVGSLKILSITNCNKFSTLPDAICKLSKLQVLRLCSSIGLCELPETTERLNNLQHLDISGCFQLIKLPLGIGNLQKLKKISMRNCCRCNLPDSMKNLENLKVKCDEGTVFLWEILKQKMKNLTIIIEEEEHHLNMILYQ